MSNSIYEKLYVKDLLGCFIKDIYKSSSSSLQEDGAGPPPLWAGQNVLDKTQSGADEAPDVKARRYAFLNDPDAVAQLLDSDNMKYVLDSVAQPASGKHKGVRSPLEDTISPVKSDGSTPNDEEGAAAPPAQFVYINGKAVPLVNSGDAAEERTKQNWCTGRKRLLFVRPKEIKYSQLVVYPVFGSGKSGKRQKEHGGAPLRDAESLIGFCYFKGFDSANQNAQDARMVGNRPGSRRGSEDNIQIDDLRGGVAGRTETSSTGPARTETMGSSVGVSQSRGPVEENPVGTSNNGYFDDGGTTTGIMGGPPKGKKGGGPPASFDKYGGKNNSAPFFDKGGKPSSPYQQRSSYEGKQPMAPPVGAPAPAAQLQPPTVPPPNSTTLAAGAAAPRRPPAAAPAGFAPPPDWLSLLQRRRGEDFLRIAIDHGQGPFLEDATTKRCIAEYLNSVGRHYMVYAGEPPPGPDIAPHGIMAVDELFGYGILSSCVPDLLSNETVRVLVPRHLRDWILGEFAGILSRLHADWARSKAGASDGWYLPMDGTAGTSAAKGSSFRGEKEGGGGRGPPPPQQQFLPGGGIPMMPPPTLKGAPPGAPSGPPPNFDPTQFMGGSKAPLNYPGKEGAEPSRNSGKKGILAPAPSDPGYKAYSSKGGGGSPAGYHVDKGDYNIVKGGGPPAGAGGHPGYESKGGKMQMSFPGDPSKGTYAKGPEKGTSSYPSNFPPPEQKTSYPSYSKGPGGTKSGGAPYVDSYPSPSYQTGKPYFEGAHRQSPPPTPSHSSSASSCALPSVLDLRDTTSSPDMLFPGAATKFFEGSHQMVPPPSPPPSGPSTSNPGGGAHHAAHRGTSSRKAPRNKLFLTHPFPIIRVMRHKPKLRDSVGKPIKHQQDASIMYGSEEWFSVDNRRLLCLQRRALMLEQLFNVECYCMCVEMLDDTHAKEIKKFRTR